MTGDKPYVGALEDSALVQDALSRLEDAIHLSLKRSGTEVKSIALSYLDSANGVHLYVRGCACDDCIAGYIWMFGNRKKIHRGPDIVAVKKLHS